MVSSLPTTVLLPFLDLSMRATYLFRLILLHDFITLNTCDELQITTISSMCSFLRPPATSSLLGSNTLLKSLLSNTFPLRSQVPRFTPDTKRLLILCFGATAPQWARASSFTRFLDHTRRHRIVGRTPLDEWSACRRDLYLTTHNTHNRQTSKPPVGFEPKISAGERPQTYALDRTATGTGILKFGAFYNSCLDRKL